MVEELTNMEEALKMYEESFKQFDEGEVITGTVIAITKDSVIVDIGYKSEGAISQSEFKDKNGNLSVKVGDIVEVMIESWNEEDERVKLSKEKAEKVKIWEDIKTIFEKNEIIEGTVLSRIKGGFAVDIGIQGFLPGSQADLKPIKNMDELIGKTFKFKILKFNKKRSNIVLSRRSILEAEKNEEKEKTLSSIFADKVIEGTIKNITDYGVFVDLGGMDGLLHITDISWGRVKHPSEIYSVGDKITVKVLAFDADKQRVSLGIKQLTEDPWIKASEKYTVGAKVSGKVVSLTDYGTFVELEKGVEGLIHISEMFWTKKVRHPSKFFSLGDTVEAIILEVKSENRRISLGIKQLSQNPWDLMTEKYPVGTLIEGKIKNITDFGIFVGIDNDIDGLVHISDLSWTKRIKHPSELYKNGDTVRAIVLDIDKEAGRFSLGIKQTQTDPWEGVDSRYAIGAEVEGLITNVTDFGVFVELEEGVEGLVHISEISEKKVKTPVGKYKIGDKLSTLVMNINVKERRIGLSIKQLGEEEEELEAPAETEEKPKENE